MVKRKRSKRSKRTRHKFGATPYTIRNESGIQLRPNDMLFIENLKTQRLYQASINRSIGNFIQIMIEDDIENIQNYAMYNFEIVAIIRNNQIIWESGTHKENNMTN